MHLSAVFARRDLPTELGGDRGEGRGLRSPPPPLPPPTGSASQASMDWFSLPVPPPLLSERVKKVWIVTKVILPLFNLTFATFSLRKL